MDVVAVYEATCKAVERARLGKGPSFLIFDTYRYYGHGMSDRERPYRSREEENEWRAKRDPVQRLLRWLKENGHATQPALYAIYEEGQQTIASAIEFAKNAPDPEPG